MSTSKPPVTIRVGDRFRVRAAPAGTHDLRTVTLTVREIGRWDFEVVYLRCDSDDPAMPGASFNHFHWSQFGPGGGCKMVTDDETSG